MIVIGIDPGIDGALAEIKMGKLVDIFDMPAYSGRIDGKDLRYRLQPYIGHDVRVYLEDNHAMPKNGSKANFSMGLSIGIITGVVQAIGLPLVRVSSQRWKAKMGLTGKPKEAARGIARELYPDWADALRLVKHGNRADAVMIARYGLFTEMHEQNFSYAEAPA